MDIALSTIAEYFVQPRDKINRCIAATSKKLGVTPASVINEVYQHINSSRTAKEFGQRPPRAEYELEISPLPDEIIGVISHLLDPEDFIKLCYTNKRVFGSKCGTLLYWTNYLRLRSLSDWIVVLKYIAVYYGVDLFRKLNAIFEAKIKEYDFSAPLDIKSLKYKGEIKTVSSDEKYIVALEYIQMEIENFVASKYPLPTTPIYVYGGGHKILISTDAEFIKAGHYLSSLYDENSLVFRDIWNTLHVSIIGRLINRFVQTSRGQKVFPAIDKAIIHNILLHEVNYQSHKMYQLYQTPYDMEKYLVEYIANCVGSYVVFPTNYDLHQMHNVFMVIVREILAKRTLVDGPTSKFLMEQVPPTAATDYMKLISWRFFNKILLSAYWIGNKNIIESILIIYSGNSIFRNDLNNTKVLRRTPADNIVAKAKEFIMK